MSLIAEWGLKRIKDTDRYSHPEYKGTIRRDIISIDNTFESWGERFVVQRAIELAKVLRPKSFASIKRYGYRVQKICVYLLIPEIIIHYRMGRSKKQFRIAINLKTGQENIKYQDKHDQGYLESKSVRSIVKKLYPKIMQAADMRAGINDIKVGLDNLSARIAELCEAMQYGPGGPVARDAQAHFESLLKPE